jgi:hypothetical protein
MMFSPLIIMLRSRKVGGGNPKRLTITVGDDQLRQIARIARERRTSAAAVIRWALDAYISDQVIKAGALPARGAGGPKVRSNVSAVPHDG